MSIIVVEIQETLTGEIRIFWPAQSKSPAIYYNDNIQLRRGKDGSEVFCWQ
jgi:hypothetical protein